jgi:hypothetical protein
LMFVPVVFSIVHGHKRARRAPAIGEPHVA